MVRRPTTYEFSSIDMTRKRKIPKTSDYFSLVEFSAKWDPVPTMLTQNHTVLVKGFMGQTTSFDRNTVKTNVLVLGENRTNREARYIHGTKGKGMFTFYGGHDPEDYTHRVGDPKTELDLHPTSPGYRLILNNVLFPAAKKEEAKNIKVYSFFDIFIHYLKENLSNNNNQINICKTEYKFNLFCIFVSKKNKTIKCQQRNNYKILHNKFVEIYYVWFIK